ncbi:MAG TPA: orotidine-5'-phosphate decarboxylase [Candidatus Paceibacterota bacterium]|nr:orotidine-5'-phosphate decarboxylase [Verrucomicrobiota bacterium]HSA10145.1 orotidine-5'-phosphate decarboxylase [Candidatus Paceibacterota bacterium]
MRNPIIVALDVATAEAALKLAEQLVPVSGGFKVGNELFTIAGPEIVRRLRGMGAPVFLDLKYHDIPNTVGRAVAAAVQLDVQMLTVHTSGGIEMLKAAEKAAQESAWQLGHTPPLVLGVTVLTSLDSGALSQIGLDPNVNRQVRRLANMANQAGLRGLVCSPREVADLRQMLPASTQLVIPGIRSHAVTADDQRRTLSPRDALAQGANWLVIGRPIYAAEDPRAAAEKILKEITE